MSSRRSYDDPCGIARALDVVGERWTLLVVRELVLGPKRFVDLRAGLGKLSANVLAQRLRELEAEGLVERRTLPPPIGAHTYALTERGRELEPVLLALGRFGRAQPMPAAAKPLGTDAVVLALPTTFDPQRAHGFEAAVRLRLAGEPFLATVHDRRLAVSRDEHAPADAELALSPPTLARLLWHGGDLTQEERAGDVALTGDRTAIAQFLTLFPAPSL